MITLRDYKESDIDTLVCLANNRNVSRYLVYTFNYPYTRKCAEYWVLKGSKENRAITKVIEFNHQFVGSVGISPQTGWKEHGAEIGFWLGEAYWRKGIATRALELMTNEAFELHKYKRLFASVLAPNAASMQVLKKCGYEIEGIHKNEVIKDGKYYNVHYYAKYCF